MTKIDDKLKEIIERRQFSNFWECFDYLKMASYEEVEALLISLELFKGKVWDGVITAAKKEEDKLTWSTGATTSYCGGTVNYCGGTSSNSDIDGNPIKSDDVIVKIYFMTNKANPAYLPVYQSYIETRTYEEVPELEMHVKSLSIKLESEIGIHLFTNGFRKIKN